MKLWWKLTWDLAAEAKRLSAQLADTRDAYARLSARHYDQTREPCQQCEAHLDHISVLEHDNTQLESRCERQQWVIDEYRHLWEISVDPIPGIDS